MKVQTVDLSGGAEVIALGDAILTDAAAYDWIDGDGGSEGDVPSTITCCNLAAELMSQYERRHALLAAPQKAVQIGATNAYSVNSHQDFAGFGHRVSEFEHFQTARCGVDECFHEQSIVTAFD